MSALRALLVHDPRVHTPIKYHLEIQFCMSHPRKTVDVEPTLTLVGSDVVPRLLIRCRHAGRSDALLVTLDGRHNGDGPTATTTAIHTTFLSSLFFLEEANSNRSARVGAGSQLACRDCNHGERMKTSTPPAL